MYLFLFVSLSSVVARGLLLPTGAIDALALGALASDLGLALLLAGLGQWLLRWHRSALGLLCAAYTLLLVANMESIAALNKGVDLRDIHYLLDTDFIAASVAHFAYPVVTGLLVLAAVLVAWREQVLNIGRRVLAVWTLAAFLLLLFTSSAQWQSNQIILPGFVRAWSADNPVSQANAKPAPGLARDFSGTTTLGKQRARNIVLLVLEGISENDLTTSMPNLAALGMAGSVAEHMYTHSSQTIRGLYALLCGDYSKLSLDTTKAAEYLQLSPVQRPLCLPGALAQAGYYSSYLQAAPLAYMGKDVFMPAIGFSQVLGEESLPLRYADVGWGPDDKAFLEQAAAHIGSLHERQQPFFTTLLTVGTHHPYTLPVDQRGSEAKQSARRYLDAALPAFYNSLAEQGVWQDTLLIITSDESHTNNRGLWLARGPGIQASRLQQVYGLLDIPVSLLDYLDLADQFPNFGGRSLFRHYHSQRPLLFFSDQLYAITERGALLFCESEQTCSRGEFDVDRQLAMTLPADEAKRQYQQLQRWRQQADASLRISKLGEGITVLEDRQFPVASGQLNVLAAGKYLHLPAGRRASLRLDISYRGSGAVSVRPDLFDSAAGLSLLPAQHIPPLHNGQGLQWQQQIIVEERVETAQPTLLTPVQRGAGQVQVNLFEITLDDETDTQSTISHSPLATSIGHAGGRWNAIDYTNSNEALRQNGPRLPLMELDMSLTADGKLVCLHDWGLGYQALFKQKVNAPLSFQQFEALLQSSTLPFRPCNEASLPGILKDQADLRLVIDSWSDSEAIMKRLMLVIPEAAQRIIPQAYSPEEVLRFRSMGFQDVIWTLYRYPDRADANHVVETTAELAPWAVTLPTELASESLLAKLLQTGALVYVHTINDCDSALSLWRQGVSIYSDTLQNGDCQSRE